MAKKMSVLRTQRRQERRRLRNLRWKNLFRMLRKRFRRAETPEEKEKLLGELHSVLDKMGQRRIFHPNKVARLKSKFARYYRQSLGG
ncbi:MAG: 30S ribosomal protein S20 [Thermotogae bacterium]|nr:30S ribosomal protein S20 [Thermotogota bacterium]